ncbi:MAG: DMT family transporter [Clostridiales bacterium]
MNYIFAMLVGVTIIISMVQNGRLSNYIEIKQVTFLNFMTGLFGITLVFILTKESISIFGNFREVPFLGYTGGIIGVCIVSGATIVVRKLSTIAATMLMYSGQLLMGFVIDSILGIEISIGKILGCIMIIIGVYFNSYIENKNIETDLGMTKK